MSAYGKYQNAYKRASVNTMDQNKLIVMLYDGAIKNITFGVEQMRLGNVEKTHTHLVKSKNIVAELMASLNMDKGGEVAKNLRSLYSYMFGQLIEANMSKNPEPAMLVRKLLKEMREAWVAIGKKSTGAHRLPLHSRVWDHNQEWYHVLRQHWEEVHDHSQAIQHKQASGESI